MQTYMIRRRAGWSSATELEVAAERSRAIADAEFPDAIRWIRSYVVPDGDDALGTFCVYQARDEDAIRHHAERVGMPADEITPIAETVVVRPDPE